MQLRRVEEDLQKVHSPGKIGKSTSHTDHSSQQDEKIAYNDEHQEEGARSNSQPPVLSSGPFQEGPSSSERCPSQAQSDKRLGSVKTDQTEASMECMIESNRQDFPRDEPQHRVTETAHPTPLCPPKLSKDDMEII